MVADRRRRAIGERIGYPDGICLAGEISGLFFARPPESRGLIARGQAPAGDLGAED
jgi:Phage integrase, N-terminal SAM-like domain